MIGIFHKVFLFINEICIHPSQRNIRVFLAKIYRFIFDVAGFCEKNFLKTNKLSVNTFWKKRSVDREFKNRVAFKRFSCPVLNG